MTPSAASQQSPSQTSSANALVESLQPPLRQALSSLNINLDYELARYRYAKRGEVQPSVQPPQFQRRRRSLSLINVPYQPQRSNSAAQPSTPPAANAAHRSVTPPPPPPNPRIYGPNAPSSGAVPPTVGAHPVGSQPGGPASEVAALRSAIVHQPDQQPDTYLASSEALLNNFDPYYPASEPEAFTQTPSKRWFEGLNTPLGLGALMLLLVASAGFGFVLVNPSVAQNLFSNTPLARLWPATEAETTGSSEVALEESDETAEFEGPPINALSPDLSQKEFSDLDLNTLSNLPSNTPAPAIAGSPVGADATAESDPRQLRPEANNPINNRGSAATREVNEMPRTTTPAPQPAPLAPTYQEPYQPPAATPAPQAAPAAPAGASQPAPPTANDEPASREPASSYYVVTDYTGDPSLNSAREVVGDAYVRNFDIGARIQLGAFNTEEGAAALAEELESQGISAEIFEPQ